MPGLQAWWTVPLPLARSLSQTCRHFRGTPGGGYGITFGGARRLISAAMAATGSLSGALVGSQLPTPSTLVL